MNEINDYPSYVALQKENFRYVYQYHADQNKYSVTREHMYDLGSSMSVDYTAKESAPVQIAEIKERGYLQFRNPAEVSWYATRENNTPYDEQWEVKNGYLIPINSHSTDVYTFSGTVCRFVDQWLDMGSDVTYLLVQCKEDEDFYYARVLDENKKFEYEFDHKPTHTEVMDMHIDNIAEIAINRQEEEVYERIYGNADRLAIEREVKAEMKAEELFKEIMEGMADATLREMDSVESYSDSYPSYGYDRIATSYDFEHFRDYGHTWGPGLEEPKPTREEQLESFTKHNMEENKELLPLIEKALLKNVPESRIREVLLYDFCGDFVLTKEEIKERLNKSLVRAGQEESWVVLNEPVSLRADNGTWIELNEVYSGPYIDKNGYVYDVYWGFANSELQIILNPKDTQNYLSSPAFSEKYISMDAELTDMDDYSWNIISQNPEKYSNKSIEVARCFLLDVIKKEIEDRGEDGNEPCFHTWTNPKLHDYSTEVLKEAAGLITKALADLKKSLREQREGIEVDGHIGTWYVIDEAEIDGKKLFLLEHEDYGDEAACLVVDEKATLVLDEVWNGFADYMEQIIEPLAEKCKAAMGAAGYNYDELNSAVDLHCFNGEYDNKIFFTWHEMAEWLDGVVFDDPEVSDAVEQIMHPERFPGCQRKGR